MKQLVVGPKAREKAIESLTLIAEAVGSTLGPSGLPVILDRKNANDNMQPSTTKDGVTVINSMQFDEPILHAVHYFAVQAATHSVLESGDGTTSTVVLAAALANAIASENSTNPQAYARAVTSYVNKCIQKIKEKSYKTTDRNILRSVGLTSCNGDIEIADAVMEAVGKTSRYGTILIEKNPGAKEKYCVSYQDGYNAGRGYNYHNQLAQSVSDKPYENAPFVLQHPYVYLYNGELNDLRQLEPIVSALNTSTGGKFNLLVFAYDVDEGVCNKLVEINRTYDVSNPSANGKNIKIFVSKIRQTAEINSGLQILMDIASISTAKVFDGGNYQAATPLDAGRVTTATVYPYKTILHGRNEAHWVPKRAQENQNAIDNARSDLDKDVIRTRNAELTDGLVTITVGGGHAASVFERADRVDDAVKAVQAAIRGGIVPGSGLTYLRSALECDLPDNLVRAMCAITLQIFKNHGTPFEVTSLARTIRNGLGKADDDRMTYSIKESGEYTFEPFDVCGIIDAADTACSVLKNATELAILCATTNCYTLTADLGKIEEMRRLKGLINEAR